MAGRILLYVLFCFILQKPEISGGLKGHLSLTVICRLYPLYDSRMLAIIDMIFVYINCCFLNLFYQCCYSLIDSLLEGTDLTGNITQAVDVILCPDVSFLQVPVHELQAYK